jgi:lipopolysaccharide transport system permease protein
VTSPDHPTVIIRPRHGWVALSLVDLWRYRELLFILAWRDIKVRYKQTFLGVLWAVIQPFVAMVVFSIFFGKLAKMPSDGIPYPVFVYCGLLPWQLFARAMTESAGSVTGNQALITKVFFPRILIPFSTVLPGLVDFFIALAILGGLMAYFGIAPSLQIILVLPFLVLALVIALGVGLWFSALNVKYRDVRYTVPFLVQIWMFATPVVYPSSLLAEPWRTIYGLNPMVGVVEGFRWAMLGTENPPTNAIWLSVGVAALIFLSGLFYFRQMERNFADKI